MAEEKKPFDKKPGGDKKPEKPAGWNLDPAEGAILLLVAITILTTLAPSVWRFVSSGELSFFGIKLPVLFAFFKNNLQIFKVIGFTIAGVAAVGTFILTKKGDRIWREEKARLYPKEMPMGETAISPEINPTMEKWAEIVNKVETPEESNWRLAIIEADIILDSLLERLNLPGATTGDKLKAVEPSDFLTLDQAWEAHKARNNIAHQGDDFLFNQREARRIISLYERVFKEFHLI